MNIPKMTEADLAEIAFNLGVVLSPDAHKVLRHALAARDAQWQAALAEQEPVAGWSYESHEFGDVWARRVILNRPDGGANPPTKHNGGAIRNVRPLYTHPAPSTPAAQERAEPVAPAVRETLELAEEALGWHAAGFCEDSMPELTVEALKAIRTLLSATPPAPAQPAPYGHCPQCGARGVMRERSPNGKTTCTNGHEFPHARFDAAQPSPEPSKPEQAEAPGDSDPLTPEQEEWVMDLAEKHNLGRRVSQIGTMRGVAPDVFYTDASYRTGELFSFAAELLSTKEQS